MLIKAIMVVTAAATVVAALVKTVSTEGTTHIYNASTSAEVAMESAQHSKVRAYCRLTVGCMKAGRTESTAPNQLTLSAPW